jgi:IclR family acetate operon transcriptional repressor
MTSINNVDRAIAIIEELSENPEGMTLTAVSERAGLPKSATHRILATLVTRGFVQQTGSGYRLTLRIATLGFRLLARNGWLDRCQSHLNLLASELGELARLAIIDGERIVWVAAAQGSRGRLIMDPEMGREPVPHATATGKVWLASLPTERAISIAVQRGFGDPARSFGPNAITSAEDLIAELRKTREQGYGTAFEESEPGLVAVALPLRSAPNPDAPLAAILTVAGPVFRMPPTRVVKILPFMSSTAAELTKISSLLQYWSGTGRIEFDEQKGAA